MNAEKTDITTLYSNINCLSLLFLHMYVYVYEIQISGPQ
jgi:hypothetical protein